MASLLEDRALLFASSTVFICFSLRRRHQPRLLSFINPSETLDHSACLHLFIDMSFKTPTKMRKIPKIPTTVFLKLPVRFNFGSLETPEQQICALLKRLSCSFFSTVYLKVKKLPKQQSKHGAEYHSA